MLVTKCLVLPLRLLELARLGSIRVLVERLSTLVELGRVARIIACELKVIANRAIDFFLVNGLVVGVWLCPFGCQKDP